MDRIKLARFLFGALFSAALWAGVALLYAYGLGAFKYAPGVYLLFLPSGLRLALLLIFRESGAAGIAISHPLHIALQYPDPAYAFAATQAIIAGPIAFHLLCGALNFLGVSNDLRNFRSEQLPLIALFMASVIPLLSTVAEVSFLVRTFEEATQVYAARVLGSFLGAFTVVLFLALSGKYLRRMLQE